MRAGAGREGRREPSCVGAPSEGETEGDPGASACLTLCPLPRKCCLPSTRNISLSSWYPGHPTVSTPGPHQPAQALPATQPHRPLELRVRRPPAVTPAFSTARAPPGTLDLIPRLGPFLGLPTDKPLSGGPSGLQSADQRHGCTGPVDARGRALSLTYTGTSRPRPSGVRNTTLHRKPPHWRGADPPLTCNL